MKSETILLVEDDPEDAEIIGIAFQRAGSPFKTVLVSNGEEAIHYLSRQGQYADRSKFPDPALVLLDLTLPKVDGFGVLEWMGSQPEDSMPPVVVLSYSNSETDIRRAHQLGAEFYLIKSVALEGTVGLVKSVENFWKHDFLPRLSYRAATAPTQPASEGDPCSP